VLTIEQLEEQLNDFSPSIRRDALIQLSQQAARGEIPLPDPRPEVNIHFHSFFSFNSGGWSPSRIAWEARKYGLEVAGIVDFDVLEGMEEFLEAGDLLALKTVVGLETRVFVPEYADKVINSPNEPGIHYFMAQGCWRQGSGVRGQGSEGTLQNMRRTARDRNLQVTERVNEYLGDVVLDWERDVLPLTPSGNATERHLLLAYDRKAREVHGERAPAFWAGILGLSETEARALMSDTAAFHENMRSKLIKFGGVGYVPPASGSFPTLEEAVRIIRSIGALPVTTWLDGTSEGERDMMANLDLFTSKGVVGMNIIPDRNWNIASPEEKAVKLAKLREAVEAARAFDLPLSVGTEMNRPGQPFVDNFAAPELADYVDEFVRGAQFYYGHSLLARWADFGYFSEGAEAAFEDDRHAKNRFFAEIGAAARPSRELYERLRERAGSWEPHGLAESLPVPPS